MTHPFRKKVKHKLFNFYPDRQARKHPCKQSRIAPVLIGSPGQSVNEANSSCVIFRSFPFQHFTNGACAKTSSP